jgi:signal transduction histidine kinase/ActR/RegA family two-component response regulator
MAGVGLRRRLFLLAAAGIVPVAAASGIALYALAQQQRSHAERATLELARALGTAVDAELRRSLSVLEALATSPLLDTGNMKDYYALAKRVVETRPFWMAVSVADPSGKVLADTQFPFGAARPPVVDRESFDRTVRTRKPAVGNLAKGPAGNIGFRVRSPVMRDGKLRYVLTAVVMPEAIVEIIRRQRVQDDWVISVFDANGMRVARSRAHQESLGTPASPSLQKLIARGGSEGSGSTRALEGDPILTAYVRLEPIGWWVAPGIPLSLVNEGVLRSIVTYGGGILLSILLGGLAALFIARGISRPIADLRDAAQALGRGARPGLPETNIVEIREAANALLAAETERAHSEAEREQLLIREQAARAAAEAANRAKDEFLAMLGHELRNPLGAISNAARLLEHPAADADASLHARQIIGRQVDHLARMTDDLLDAGRAITGKIALQRRPVDLAAATAATLATLKPRTDGHRVVQELESAWVDADPTRLEQIITNLLVNAVKYTPPDGTIRVTVRREAAQAVLRVADDGIGMSAELAARAFDLFVQGDPGIDRSRGGLGIGLTLVRRLAELHGGSAEAASAGANRGSELVVRLPAIAGVAAAEPRAESARRPRTRDILIVEDNDDARESLRKLLEFAGHRVRAERDGAAGLQSALSEEVDVVLLDIGLPKMDGYEVARRITQARRSNGGRRPLLVALTGYGLAEDRQRAFEAGFDAHLVKPMDEAELDKLLARLD